MKLYQHGDGNYSTISGNYRKIIFLSTLLLLINCVHIQYKFAGLSEVPTQFTDSNSNTGAPVLTFPGGTRSLCSLGADNPTVVSQGLMLDSTKHMVFSTHFETSSKQYSFGLWVYYFENNPIRYISGINAGVILVMTLRHQDQCLKVNCIEIKMVLDFKI
ncbi:unnamed protein product [Moneuplotes crassus]|uniref:Uncharacterized protein n=1 Tax=Euplotes crassus TaxID=5936 RepID=A0AAD1U0N7_EUPCR|nr:unnamed protein product [Moneuplotes crassus]